MKNIITKIAKACVDIYLVFAIIILIQVIIMAIQK